MTSELTVMMPVHNGGPYLRAAVESILAQTLSNLKLLIIDDGSQDGSGALLQELADADARIELIRREKRGQVATRNELLQRAQTEFVACADADDISLPTRLARQLSIMKQDPELVALGCQLQVIDKDGRIIGELRRKTGAAKVREAFLRGTAISQPSCMLRRSALLAIGGYRECYAHAEDYDMFLCIAEIGKVDNADFCGIHYRVHEASVSHRYAVRQMASAELARATYALRRAGEPDPTEGWQEAPAYDHPVMQKLVPSAALYAALETVHEHPGEEPLLRLVSATFSRRQQRHVQRALIEAVRRRQFDALSARALMRALALGPARFVRCYRSAARRPQRAAQAGRTAAAA